LRILKGIVFALVLANVAYYLWARGIAPPLAPPGAASVPRLALASEVAAPGAIPAAASAPPASAASAASAPSSAAATAAVASTPAGAAAAPASMAAESPAGATRCISVGPFLDVAEAARAAATLRRGGYQPRQRVAEGTVWAGVWVYLERPSSAAGIARVRTRLRRAGIDNAPEMPGPHGASVISLGLFSEPRRAAARIKLARSIGFAPQVAKRQRPGDVYWVDVDLKPTDPDLSPAAVEGGSRIVRLQVVPCSGA